MIAATLRRFDGPDALALEEWPTPEPGPGELLVRVEAVSVNRTLDLAVMHGRWPRLPRLPHVPGVDPAGAVEAVGEGVEGWRPGERVAVGSARCGACDGCREGRTEDCAAARMPGVARWGGMATHVVVAAAAAHRVPDGVDQADAAFAVRHGSLALHMLRRRGALRPGERVLVTGATGALGAAAAQLAATLGAEVVAAAGGGRGAGTIGYDALPGLAGTVDVAIETTGAPAVWEGALAALRHGGRLVGSAAGGDGRAGVDLRRLYTHRLTVMGASLGRIGDADEALAIAAAGELRAPVAAALPLSRVRDAYALAADRAVSGKIIVEPGRDV